MEHILAKKFSNFLLSSKIISQEYYDIYLYGNELLLSFIFSTSFIILFGLLFKRIIQTLLFFSIFIFVRRQTGGYHAQTYFRCKLTTIMTYFSVLVLAELTNIITMFYVVLFVLGLSIIISIGPIENPNKPISVDQRRRTKLTGVVLFTIILVFGVILHCRQSSFSNSIFFTLLSIIILMIVAKTQEILRTKGGK